jgi:hypothetical protein
MNPPSYILLISDNREKIASSSNVAGKIWHVHATWNFEASAKKSREYIELLGIDDNFLTGTPMTQQLRERTSKWYYMKLKSFCMTSNSHQSK